MIKSKPFQLGVAFIVVIMIASVGTYVVHRTHAITNNADFNNDGTVNILDLSILATHYGQTGMTQPQGDANGDGAVTILDLSILASAWGSSPTCTGVTVSPTATNDIVNAVNNPANGAGTTFCITGSHSITTAILPKAGDSLIGAPGSVIDGGNTATLAIDGNNANSVTVKGLLIQHFNNTNLIPAVGKNNEGSGWDIENNEIAFNTTEGLFAGASSIVRNNHIHNNGQLGISGFQANNALITINEVDHNGSPQYVTNEGGGIKFFKGTNITVSNNKVHDNDGDGIWFDTDITGSTITGNTLANNVDATNHAESIAVELACNDMVTSNTITGTAYSGIWLSSSHDIQVTGNTINGPTHTIRLWSDNTRSTQAVCGPPSVSNDKVTTNTETLASGSSFTTGVYIYNGGTGTGPAPTGVSFTGNTYHMPDCTAAHWQWYVTSNANVSFAGWQTIPQDTTASSASCGL